MTDAIDKLDSQPVCHCGHCRTAYEIALAEFQQHYTGSADQAGCLHWYLAVVAAHSVIAQVLVGNFPKTQPNLDRIGDAMASPPVIEALVHRAQDIIDARGATKQ